METVNAHLVKSDVVICLDKSPVKPVVLETDSAADDCAKSIKIEKAHGKVTNGFQNGHGAGESLPAQNGKEETCKEDQKEAIPTEDEKQHKKLSNSKKPLSFDLLPFEISKQCKPSRRGKLARQRTVSEASYQKQTYRLEHAKSDPTDLMSMVLKEEEIEEDDPKKVVVKESTSEEKIEDREDASKTKEIDSLAEQLGSNLKIAPSSLEGKTAEKDEVSELADDLQKGLSVTDDSQEVKQKVSESSSDKVVVKEEKEDKDSTPKLIVKTEPVSTNKTLIVKKEPADTKESATSFKDRILQDKPGQRELVSKGPIGNHQRDQTPMVSYSGHQRMPQQSRAIVIPGFQETFIQNPQRHNQITQEMQQQAWLQKQQLQQVQQVQPPYYAGPNHQHQQPISVPPPMHRNQTIIVPPPATHQSSMPSGNYLQNRYIDQLQQNQGIALHQQQHWNNAMALQQPGYQQQEQQIVIKQQSREPVENAWPPQSDPFEDVYSDTSSNVCSPPQVDDTEQLHSPNSAMSDTSSTATEFSGLNPISPLMSQQGSPPGAMYSAMPGSSPYHRVPASPELLPVFSPQNGVPSPGSPTNSSHQIITTKSQNMGVVTITDPASKPPSPKRQCVEVDQLDNAKKSISDIVDYLKSGSPGSPGFEQDSPVHMPSPPHTMQSTVMTIPETTTTQSITTSQHSRVQSFSDQQNYPAPSPSQSTSSCDTPSPSPNPTRYQLEHSSPTPGLSAVDPYGRISAGQDYYSYVGVGPQMMISSAPSVGMTPTQDQGFDSLQQWRQKVGMLSDKQLREQDDDKDT